MSTRPESCPPPPAAPDFLALDAELRQIDGALRQAEAAAAPVLAGVDPKQYAGARNLVHYLALRQRDLRALQDRLAGLGLSSLGRSEADVLTGIERVRRALAALGGTPSPARDDKVLAGRPPACDPTEAVFGPGPAGRDVRIMVTLPAQVADDAGLAGKLVAAGMDIARINAAHDNPDTWRLMAERVRRAARLLGRPVTVLIDLPGSKLRTGPLPDEPPVLKLRPRRDAYGRVLVPARLQLVAETGPAAAAADGEPTLQAPRAWLDGLAPGMEVRAVDARGRDRRLHVAEVGPGAATLASKHTVYIVEATQFRAGERRTAFTGLPARKGRLTLRPGDRLELRRPDLEPTAALSIPCTAPEVFAQVRAGERIAFDDGRIAGVIRHAGPESLDIEIAQTRGPQEKLAADQGINLPETALSLPLPTPDDLAVLDVAVEAADLIALSFVQRVEDVRALQAAMRERKLSHLPVLLKIETRLGFENLPDLLLAAMTAPAVGMMIARGDLAVELGWQRLAEVQEEMLWAAEAAHVPVVWATQVLESLARSGLPSRAEITDAAMSVRAEAVMLNKGPFVTEAIEMLDDILRRMQAHQHKKRPLLRALRSWHPPAAARSCPGSQP
ncbi:pyruvate kinase [Pseudorhodoferax sp.]|uniref:pyruvate kinase n=1 Tax=Pseudorhodoferax sp. TaxID=1993553 RepID=UPI002DD6963C|nr:pyruvate kinase [Pseudorhodoferax sp.]